MNSSLVCLLALLTVASAANTYSDRYDNIDLTEVITNRRVLIPYLKCLLEKGRCSPEGDMLKSHIRQALAQNCAKCTERQRMGSRVIIAHLINNENKYWKQLTAKYDPQNKHTAKYEKELTLRL